jgi:predicted polyphosphate/ATP-dependent NAD kinase
MGSNTCARRLNLEGIPKEEQTGKNRIAMSGDMKKLGLIVNPIAGMGGSVGLKGTDGEAILRKARELGAIPIAHRRAIEALRELSSIKDTIRLITCPSTMGEEEAKACSFNPAIIGTIDEEKTSSTDTKNAAREMLKLKVDLILFVGGDGTARDIFEEIGNQLPVLGVPSGVKIHSSVFAINPKIAGLLTARFLQESLPVHEAEVIDIDEEAFRHNRISARLYGYLSVPHDTQMMQAVKAGSEATENEAMEALAWQVIEDMEDDCLYIIAPGTTTKSIMKQLGLEYTLLGVDVVYQKKLIALDANENKLLGIIEGKKAKIVVTAIGGQGYILGRGNQQISSRVVQKIGKENIIVIATENKIASLKGRPLLVDTDSNDVNNSIRGYMRIITGYQKSIVYKVA